jgi:hypothetical protein
MKAQHIFSHKSDEWFDIIDSDPDCDFETGQYVGISDMLKLSNGNWYLQNECQYINKEGIIQLCG